MTEPRQAIGLLLVSFVLASVAACTASSSDGDAGALPAGGDAKLQGGDSGPGGADARPPDARVIDARTIDARVIDARTIDAAPPADAGVTSAYPFFPPQAIWYQRVDGLDPDEQSAEIIKKLHDDGGWGHGNIMQIDFTIKVLFDLAGAAPMRTFATTDDWFAVHCDHVAVPLPAGGAIEGESGYRCTHDGDCHLIVVRPPLLYEMWRANVIDGSTFEGGCLAVWDMTRVYPASGRGDQCSSADAAGYPIAPLLFTADEVAHGAIEHAIRFILPNQRIRAGFFVHPATHNSFRTEGGASSIPYGARLRLRPDYPLQDLPSEGARVVARAMQRYGMFLADGGEIALTAASDSGSAYSWGDLLDPRDLDALHVDDFQMMPAGARIVHTDDCVRDP